MQEPETARHLCDLCFTKARACKCGLTTRRAQLWPCRVVLHYTLEHVPAGSITFLPPCAGNIKALATGCQHYSQHSQPGCHTLSQRIPICVVAGFSICKLEGRSCIPCSEACSTSHQHQASAARHSGQSFHSLAQQHCSTCCLEAKGCCMLGTLCPCSCCGSLLCLDGLVCSAERKQVSPSGHADVQFLTLQLMQTIFTCPAPVEVDSPTQHSSSCLW